MLVMKRYVERPYVNPGQLMVYVFDRFSSAQLPLPHHSAARGALAGSLDLRG